MSVMQEEYGWPECRFCDGLIGRSAEDGWFHLLTGSDFCATSRDSEYGMVAVPKKNL